MYTNSPQHVQQLKASTNDEQKRGGEWAISSLFMGGGRPYSDYSTLHVHTATD